MFRSNPLGLAAGQRRQGARRGVEQADGVVVGVGDRHRPSSGAAIGAIAGRSIPVPGSPRSDHLLPEERRPSEFGTLRVAGLVSKREGSPWGLCYCLRRGDGGSTETSGGRRDSGPATAGPLTLRR